MKITSKSISKELKELSDKYRDNGVINHHNAAQKTINDKYGKGWREIYTIKETKTTTK